jgi:hypothetical protein
MTGGRVGGFAASVSIVALAALAPAAAAPVGAAAPLTVTSSESVRLAIDTCLRKLNPEIDIGYERISARCLDLARRIEASGWSVWLPPDWQRPGNDLSAGGLRQLEELLAAGDGTPTSGFHQLTVAGLHTVLASLAGDSATESHGWWTRTKAWLRKVFARGEEEDDDWFSRFAAQNGISQVAIELVSYVALALVVVLAGIILVNELRVSGLLRRLWQRFARALARPALSAAGPGIGRSAAAGCDTWDDVEKADRAFQPRLLLELLARRLAEMGCLPQWRGLTVRELTCAARLPEEADRERLVELARMSERLRFSDGPVAGEAVDAALRGGRALLERLSVGLAAGTLQDGLGRGSGARIGGGRP